MASTTLLAIACNNKPEQASIEGKIDNLPEGISEIFLRTQNLVKSIKIENGTFKDTISIDGEFAYLQIGKFGKTLFLNKNTNLIVNADANDYQNTLSYSGNGKKVNNYLNHRESITLKVFERIDSINTLDESAFNSYIKRMTDQVNLLLEENNNIDPIVIKTEKENLAAFTKNLTRQYNAINRLDTSLKKGDLSPKFNHYENYKGGTTSLDDLKGSYVYIDLWATWCPPCKAEIPYLKELEEKFHKKNIKFVSISIDNPNLKDKWQAMIKDKQMGGVQLFANGDQSFTEAYQVSGIPRFILIDTEGKIITDNAPRPSSQQIHNLLKNLP